METALTIIHDTYLDRCDSPGRQKAAWRDTISPVLPPVLTTADAARPSVMLAREAGDLGCALLWIVQAALVRPFLQLVKRQPGLRPDQQSLLSTISETDCGALAHSEPGDAPVVVSANGTGLRLNGVKKYITAGSQADFILITAREPGENKVSRLLLLPISAVTPAEMEVLDLNALRTTSHGRLAMNNKTIPGLYLLPLSPSLLRKKLKVNGLVERCLILEAVLAVMTYLNQRLSRHFSRPPADETVLNELAVLQTAYTTAAIRQAQNDETVLPQWVDLTAVNTAIADICRAAEGISPEPGADLGERIRDLRFIRSLWG